MKISYNWLQKFIKNGPKNPEEIGEKLTLHTAELEDILDVSGDFENIFLGLLVNIESHKDSDSLFVGTFDLGDLGTKKVVYKDLHVLREGVCYPVAISGARLQSGIVVEDSSVKGVLSAGMVCDNADLGLSLDGLLEFPREKKGMDFSRLDINLRDYLFDIDNKSLTHRPDLMGIRGFSREISAIFGKDLIHPEPLIMLPSTTNEIDIEVLSPSCQRFCALRMDGVENCELDLSDRITLSNLGVKSISGLVDITNLIMLEFGQPMHVFDADKIKGKMTVRQAVEGEKIIALDDLEYELDETITVVADEEKVLSIAGIMGGRDSGVSLDTKNIIFECASWDAASIRKSAQKIGLRSESSGRYEKSLDPEACKKVLFAAVEKCLEKESAAKITTQLTDIYNKKQSELFLDLSMDKLRNRSGVDISDVEIIEKLELVGFGVKSKGDLLSVVVPSYRATKDIKIEEDLIEEVVRLYGFSNIEGKLPNLPITPPKRNRLRELEWDIKDFLSGRNFLEVYNYDFVSQLDVDFTRFSGYTEIKNPLSSDYQFLRQTLISNLIRGLDSELKTFKSLDLFEFGKVYLPSYEVLPREVLNFSAIKVRLSGNETETFYELKDTLESLFASLKILELIDFKPFSEENLLNYIHPKKSAEIWLNGQKVGVIGCLHPLFVPVKKSHLAFFELNLEQIFAFVKDQGVFYKEVSNFPLVYRDLSIVLDDTMLISDIEKIAKKSASFLKNIELFDEYKDDEKLGVHLKNLAFHLAFQAPDKTLGEGEVDSNFLEIVTQLKKELNAELRLEFDKNKKG